MIKILKGTATELEIKALEKALQLRDQSENDQNSYGNPILRGDSE